MRPSRNQALIMSLASEIKSRRNELSITQEDLASRCELDRPYLSLIEVGRKQPSISVLYRIATALDFTLAELSHRVEQRYRIELDAALRDQSSAKASSD